MDKHDVVTEVRSKLTGETLEHFNWLLCVWNTDRDHDYPSTDKDRHEFRQYLRQCTNAQVQGVYEKELAAGRHEYAELAESEAILRGLYLS